MTTARPLRLASIALSVAAFAAGLVALPDTASAQRVRVRVGGGGGFHVRGGANVRYAGPRGYYRPTYRPYAARPYVARPYYRPYYRPPYVRFHYRPYVYVPSFYYWGWGFHYAYPPPPPCYYYDCVPGPYYVAPPPAVVAAPAPAPEPPLPRVGFGVFGGGVNVEGNDAGTDLGLLGRFRLSDHFMLEAELAKTEIDNGARVDRRFGGSLLVDLAPRSVLSPYILGGGGFGQADVNNGTLTADQGYGEVGIGLELHLGRQFSVIGDLRAGVRKSNVRDDEVLLVVGGDGGAPRVDDTENFSRARIGALLYF